MSNFRDRPLAGYLPNAILDVRDFQLILDTEQPEVFKLFEAIQLVLDNQFVMSSTEYGVKRWENMLGLRPVPAMTLDERKFTILAMLMNRLPYTVRMLERLLIDLCGEDGFEIQLDHKNYSLKVKLELFSNFNAEAIAVMLRRICPANLMFTTSNDTVMLVKIHCIGAMLQTKTHNLRTTISI